MARIFFLLILASLFYYIINKYKDHSKVIFFFFVFSATLRLGYIFYNYNGILLLDVFLFYLLFIEMSHFKNFRLFVPKIAPLFFIFILWALMGTLSLYIQKFSSEFHQFFSLCSLNSLAEVTKFIRAYLIIVVVYNFLIWKKDLYLLLDSLFITIFFHSLVSLYQWRMGPVGLTMLGEIHLYSYRSYGLFQHPNFLGDCLILIIPILIRLFFFEKVKKKALYCGVILGASSLSLFVTFARGTWISLCLALVFMFILDVFKQNIRKIRKVSLIFSVVMVGLFLIRYAPRIQERFVEDFERERGSAAEVRIPLMQVAFNMIKDKPVFGGGLGNYSMWTSDYSFESEKFSQESLEQITHNSYLLLAAENGIFGFFIYMIIVLIVLVNAFKSRNSKSNIIKNISLGIFWGMVAILITFNTGPDYMIHEVLNLFWILGGSALGLHGLSINLDRYLALNYLKNKNSNSFVPPLVNQSGSKGSTMS